MNKQDSAPGRHSHAGAPAKRRIPRDEAVRLAWLRAGLDTDSGVLIVGEPGIRKSVMSKRLITSPDARALHREAG